MNQKSSAYATVPARAAHDDEQLGDVVSIAMPKDDGEKQVRVRLPPPSHEIVAWFLEAAKSCGLSLQTAIVLDPRKLAGINPFYVYSQERSRTRPNQRGCLP
jgi:hypothetical protein